MGRGLPKVLPSLSEPGFKPKTSNPQLNPWRTLMPTLLQPQVINPLSYPKDSLKPKDLCSTPGSALKAHGVVVEIRLGNVLLRRAQALAHTSSPGMELFRKQLVKAFRFLCVSSQQARMVLSLEGRKAFCDEQLLSTPTPQPHSNKQGLVLINTRHCSYHTIAAVQHQAHSTM